MLPAFLALLVLQLIGELLVQSLGLPLPGPLVGMLLLLAALVWRGQVPDGLKQVGDALLQNLVLLFVPAVTGVMMLFERVGREWWPLLAGGVGGEPSLTAVAVALTGISGAIIARYLLNLFRFDNPAVRGFALGITAHAIGTARALQVNPTAGAFSALAMGLNGVATALLVPLVLKLLQLTP